MCFISKPPNMAYSNLSNSNGEIISFNRKPMRYESYYMDHMILTDHIDISTAFLHSRPSKRPCKVFHSFGFPLVDIEAIGETVYIKNCLHVMIYVQMSPILRLSHRFLSTENFHYGYTFIKDYKYYFYNMPEWNVRYNQFHMQHILYLYLVHVVHCRQGVQGFTIWIRFYDK